MRVSNVHIEEPRPSCRAFRFFKELFYLMGNLRLLPSSKLLGGSLRKMIEFETIDDVGRVDEVDKDGEPMNRVLDLKVKDAILPDPGQTSLAVAWGRRTRIFDNSALCLRPTFSGSCEQT